MSKKQLRLNRREDIHRKAVDFINKPIDLVLADQSVIHGVLNSVSADNLVLKNMRLQKITIALRDISEFFADLES